MGEHCMGERVECNGPGSNASSRLLLTCGLRCAWGLFLAGSEKRKPHARQAASGFALLPGGSRVWSKAEGGPSGGGIRPGCDSVSS